MSAATAALGARTRRPAERWLGAARYRIRGARYEPKWVVLATIIGVIGGLGAVVFTLALESSTRFFLGLLVGFTPASPTGEGGAPITDALRPWALPLCVGLGGLLSGIIVFRLAPEAEGHGTDAAIAAFHHRPRGIRGRVPIVKLVASAITIGSGGSAGREGPTAQISAGFGSFLSRLLDLDQHDSRIAVAAGMAAGIGAIFRAPLGAAVLGAELMYRDDVESSALLPSFIATIVAFSVYGLLLGNDPIFGPQAAYHFDPLQLGYYALIGLAAGVMGLLYIRSFYGVTRWAGGWTAPVWLRPAIGGLLVGTIGLVVPGVLGTGYGWAQASLGRETLLALPLLMVLILPFAKILATSLSIGSGGSGGVFGPGMVIGGLVGAGIWRLLAPVAPDMPVDPAPFVIVGMMALFGSIAHAPLAVMLMVAEMTGDLAMLAPAMVSVGVAMLVVRDRSIYHSQLATKADSPAHRFKFAMPVLATLPVRHAMRAPRVVLDTSLDAVSAARSLDAAGVSGAPIRDAEQRYVGILDRARIDVAGAAGPVTPLVDRDAPTVSPQDALDEALGAIAESPRQWAPVVEADRVVGVLSVRDVIAGYRAALAGSVRQVRGLHDAGVLLQAEVADGATLDGLTVAGVPWPTDTTLISIERDSRLVVPRGDVLLRAGDRLTVLAADGSEAAARLVIGSASPDADPAN